MFFSCGLYLAAENRVGSLIGGFELVKILRQLGLPLDEAGRAEVWCSYHNWITRISLPIEECRNFPEFSNSASCSVNLWPVIDELQPGDCVFKKPPSYPCEKELAINPEMTADRVVHLIRLLHDRQQQKEAEEKNAALLRVIEYQRAIVEKMKADIVRMEDVIRSAAADIGASRQFVRSKALAALRHRLEAAVPVAEESEG